MNIQQILKRFKNAVPLAVKITDGSAVCLHHMWFDIENMAKQVLNLKKIMSNAEASVSVFPFARFSTFVS